MFRSAASTHTMRSALLDVASHIGANREQVTSSRFGWPIQCRNHFCVSGATNVLFGSGCIRNHGELAEQREYEARFIGRMQEWLDASMGACHMRRPDVRAEVEGCLLQFDGNRYDIDAFVLMPNHVHAVIKPTPASDLSTVLQGIKGVSANRCNKLLEHKSKFWMDESYDHIVRDAKELSAFRNYIAQNPDKAGLRSEEYSLHLRDVLIT